MQESLTNVVRHAGGATATVAMRQDGGDLLVEIVNDSAPATTAFTEGAGAGLAGMRERAAALGGTLEAGPRAHGGFAVRARLPIASGVAAPPPPLVSAERAGGGEAAAGSRVQPMAGSP